MEEIGLGLGGGLRDMIVRCTLTLTWLRLFGYGSFEWFRV
jgi:hypothetical protein